MLFDKKKVASLALAAAIAVAVPVFPAKADLTADLLARSESNKALNDKKRLSTSSANFERSRTVTDGFCEFPKNFFGCEIASSQGGVKYLSDDKAVECEGTREGKVCAAKAPGSFPPFGGL
jgi:photosystem I subunit PsaN